MTDKATMGSQPQLPVKSIIYLFLFSAVCFYIAFLDLHATPYTVLVGALAGFCGIRSLIETYQKEYVAIFKMAWFIGIACIEWITLKEAGLQPQLNGDISAQYFITGEHRELQVFYECQLAYHLHSLIFAYTHGAKLEMHVHHFATVLLIVISNLTGLRQIGTYIFFLHDVPDITSGAVKFLFNTKQIVALLTVYVVHLFSWGYFRLFLLAKLIYLISTEGPLEIWHVLRIGVFFLSLLLCLHYYWYYQFFNLAFKFFKSKKLRDETEVVTVPISELRQDLANQDSNNGEKQKKS